MINDNFERIRDMRKYGFGKHGRHTNPHPYREFQPWHWHANRSDACAVCGIRSVDARAMFTYNGKTVGANTSAICDRCKKTLEECTT